MILAVDIGNTNIVVGILQGKDIPFTCRMATDAARSAAEYETELRSALEQFSLTIFDGAIISSVVPAVFPAVYDAVHTVTGQRPLAVSPAMRTGMYLHADDVTKVGSDRIVIAAGALELYTPPLILLDLGTATTIEALDSKYNYLGGCIIPGVQTALDALTARTAQLPTVSLETPQRIIGRNTVECMQSGILHGTAAMIDGMVERMETEMGCRATVVATGGLASLIVPLCRRQITLEKNLLLKGLGTLYRLNH